MARREGYSNMNVQVPTEMLEEIKRLAKEDRRTLNLYMTVLIEKHIKDCKKNL